MSPNLNSSDALLTTGSFCILFRHQHVSLSLAKTVVDFSPSDSNDLAVLGIICYELSIDQKKPII